MTSRTWTAISQKVPKKYPLFWGVVFLCFPVVCKKVSYKQIGNKLNFGCRYLIITTKPKLNVCSTSTVVLERDCLCYFITVIKTLKTHSEQFFICSLVWAYMYVLHHALYYVCAFTSADISTRTHTVNKSKYCRKKCVSSDHHMNAISKVILW